MKRRVPLLFRPLVAALLALLPVVAPTAPASASAVPMKMVRSSNWSGYALIGNAFIGVTGTFNVPVPLKSPDCLEETSVWVGVDGADNSDLLQAGVDESTFVLSSSTSRPWWQPTSLCPGRVQVYAWWEDVPSADVRVKLPVKVGDDVTVSIFKMSPGWAWPCTTSRPGTASCACSHMVGRGLRWSGWSRRPR